MPLDFSVDEADNQPMILPSCRERATQGMDDSNYGNAGRINKNEVLFVDSLIGSWLVRLFHFRIAQHIISVWSGAG
jgi:hypothetical protein